MFIIKFIECTTFTIQMAEHLTTPSTILTCYSGEKVAFKWHRQRVFVWIIYRIYVAIAFLPSVHFQLWLLYRISVRLKCKHVSEIEPFSRVRAKDGAKFIIWAVWVFFTFFFHLAFFSHYLPLKLMFEGRQVLIIS